MKTGACRRWRFELAAPEPTSSRGVPRPSGYEPHFGLSEELVAVTTVSTQQERAQKEAEALKIAMAPGGGLLSTGFMLWMSGSTIQIFSIMMIGMAFTNPIKALTNINAPFAKFAKEPKPISLTVPKLVFVGFQLLSLALALYKASTMGLLPLTSADWLSYIPMRSYAEKAGVPIGAHA